MTKQEWRRTEEFLNQIHEKIDLANFVEGLLEYNDITCEVCPYRDPCESLLGMKLGTCQNVIMNYLADWDGEKK